ncbi:hypothetical protein SB763_34070, partial [Burkholderia sp. SIMBA_042]
ALHKSVRGSNPDGALYWFARMLDGGCDPLYLARRVVRMASEDIGNADPRHSTKIHTMTPLRSSSSAIGKPGAVAAPAVPVLAPLR